MRRALLPVALLALALALGCKPKPGAKCRPGSVCLDKSTILTCIGGKYEAFPCKGADGCHENQAKALVLCDASGNAEGDACDPADDGKGECSADHKALMRCAKGKWQRLPCGGPSGCKVTGTTSHCDSRIATVGDRCDPDEWACASDGKAILHCKDKKLVEDHPCRGPGGCTAPAGSDKMNCDRSLGELGDPCDGDVGVCSMDQKSLFGCKDHKLVLLQKCRGQTGCIANESLVGCAEPGLSEPDDPCDGDGAACTPDHRRFLECKNGHFKVKRTCSRCTVAQHTVTCQ